MLANELLRSRCPGFAALAAERAKGLLEQSRASQKLVKGARIVVSWGGGKDSTIALLLARAVAEVCGCELAAYTMFHPGLTPGVMANINRVTHELAITHEFRHFNRRVVPPFDALAEEWHGLYRRLWVALRALPRFMCVACNLGAVVTEYAALCDLMADFHVTGNPAWELAAFDTWAAGLRAELGSVKFPELTGDRRLDYYRLWWAVYHALLEELKTVGARLNLSDVFDQGDMYSRYLYPLPEPGGQITKLAPLCLLPNSTTRSLSAERKTILDLLGWKLPDDIQGGTESDCSYTALIAMLNIKRKGLPAHLKDLAEATEKFQPLEEMTARAKSWALGGQSTSEGGKLLEIIHVPAANADKSHDKPLVADALYAKLVPVR